MRIFDREKELAIPIWITASSSASTVQTKTVKLNDRHGEYITGKEQYTGRTFQCSGTIPTDSASAVEKERSRLLSLLSGKDLIVYRDDDDTIFYRCRLTGQIQVTYYNGENLHKVFTISFTLKAFDPFGYGAKKVQTISAGIQTLTIENEGNHLSIPEIEITGIDYVEGVLFQCGNSFLEVNKKINLPEAGKLTYKNGCLYLNEKDISYSLSDRSIITPLYFQAGSNQLKVKVHAGVLHLSYYGRYI